MQKNIIWFFVDQLRRDAISINGDLNVSTPNIDNLAKQGVNFTQAVGGYPLCCPCRSSIISSEYPQHTGVSGHELTMKRDLPLISDIFNENNYDTIFLGKWHLAGLSINQHVNVIPKKDRGRFSTFLGYENNNSPFETYVHGHEGDKEIAPYQLKEYETIALTNLAIQKIDDYGNSKERTPFFMTLSLQPPHDPYIAPADKLQKYQPSQIKLKQNVPPYESTTLQVRQDLSGYYGAIAEIDEQLGRLQEALKRNNLHHDTHIIFFSDHGDMHGSQGLYRKTNPYEESIGVPFIIGGAIPLTYDGYISKTCNIPFNHVDIAPTTLGLCNITSPVWMKGTDFSDQRIQGKTASKKKDSVYLQNIIPTMHSNSTDRAWRGIVTDDGYKYICFEDNEWLLFNLKDDPLELVNLIHNQDYYSLRIRLNQRLKEWVLETGDVFSIPVVPRQ